MVGIGVLISGNGTNLQAIIDCINEGGIKGKIQIVLSDRRDAFGLERAKKAGIKALYINKRDYDSIQGFNDRIMKELCKQGVELVVLAGYLSFLSREFVNRYRGRIINVHPSLIPSFCGKGRYGEIVHQMAIERGVKLTGATVHFVDEGMDTGPIILQEGVVVKEDDTVETLKERVLEVEHRLLIEAIKLFCENRLFIEGKKVRIV